MSNTITGTIEKVFERKVGKGTAYSIAVNDVWYGCGFHKPDAKEGDVVTFDWENNNRGYPQIIAGADKKAKITVVDSAPAAAQGGGGTAPVNARQVSIEYQAARNSAIALLPTLIAQEAVPAVTKAKIADKYDATLLLIKELSDHFYLELQEVNEAGGVEADVDPTPGEDA